MNKQIGGSILESLRIGRKNATDAEGIAAATPANLDEFAEKLPDGWNAIIGENGGALSGRQSHTARNLTRESDQFLVAAGLSGASVDKFRNVNIENAAAHCTEATFMIIGSLAGYSMGSVTGCTVTNADVVDNSCTGGLIGGDVESVTNCPASNVTVTVIGDNDFSQGLVQCDVAERGGLIIGGGFGGMVDNCTAQGTGKAEGNEPVGMDGISCLEMMVSITNCTSDVPILSAQGSHAIGGLCCYGEETTLAVSNCTASGEMSPSPPGAPAGRAEACAFEGCKRNIALNGEALPETDATDRVYESAEQYGVSP